MSESVMIESVEARSAEAKWHSARRGPILDAMPAGFSIAVHAVAFNRLRGSSHQTMHVAARTIAPVRATAPPRAQMWKVMVLPYEDGKN